MNDTQKDNIYKLRLKCFGYSEIADSLGLNIHTVKSYCRRNNLGGVRATQKYEKGDTRFCRNCGKEFKQPEKQKQRKFCCDHCRVAWWNSHPEMVNKKAIYKIVCCHCNNEFDSYGNKTRKYCSHSCYIAKRFNKYE